MREDVMILNNFMYINIFQAAYFILILEYPLKSIFFSSKKHVVISM